MILERLTEQGCFTAEARFKIRRHHYARTYGRGFNHGEMSINKLLATNLSPGTVGHRLAVTSQLCEHGISRRLEAACSDAHDSSLSCEGMHVIAIHGYADSTNNPSVLLHQLSHHDPVDDLYADLDCMFPESPGVTLFF